MAMSVLLGVGVVAVAYAVCGVLAYGFTFAYWEAEGLWWASSKYAWRMAVLGWFGLVASIVLGGWGRHGLKFRSDW